MVIELQSLLTDRPITLLINYGANHNFISSNVLTDLGISLQPTHEYEVITRAWTFVMGYGVGREITIQLHKHHGAWWFSFFQIGEYWLLP